MSGHFKVGAAALADPAGFWSDNKGCALDKPPPKVLDDSQPPFYKWFTGGQINGCYNAVDCHVEAGMASVRPSSMTVDNR